MALPAPDSGSTALVTGASSGLGEAMARQLAERGYAVSQPQHVSVNEVLIRPTGQAR